MSEPIEPLIRLHAFEPTILTVEEFEKLECEVLAMALLDPQTHGPAHILWRMIEENRPRYSEARAIKQHLKNGICRSCAAQARDGKRCPTTPDPLLMMGCGSANIAGPDEEGFYDCMDCGLFFKPEEG